MRKVALSLLAMFLVISLAVPSAFANGNGKDKGNKKEEEQKQEILAELDSITEGTVLERIDEPLPENAEMIEFDTVEEFEAWAKELDANIKKQNAEAEDKTLEAERNGVPVPSVDGDGSDFSTMATAIGSKRIYTYDPLNLLLPNYITVNFNYNYYWLNGSKRFSSISVSSINSQGCCFGSYTTWYQTNRNGYVTDAGRTIAISIRGYHQLGIAIGGFPTNYKYYQNYYTEFTG